MNFKSKLLLPLIVLLLISCEEKSQDSEVFNYDKSQLLTDVADKYIIPKYQEVDLNLNSFESALLEFKDDQTNENYSTLENSLFELYISWQSVAFLDFGPANANALFEEFNVYPIDIERIESNLIEGNYDLGTGANSKSKGLPTLEYLISIRTADNISDIELKYMTDITNRLKNQLSYVLSAWEGEYRTEFVQNTSNDATSSITIMYNGSLSYFEKYLRDGKLAIPLGVRSNGIPNPTWIEARYTGNSLPLLKSAFNYYVEFISLNENYGFLDLIKESNAEINSQKVDLRIEEIFAEINILMEQIPEDYLAAIENQDQVLKDIFSQMQSYVTIMKVNVPQALGIQIKYSDTDGD